MALIGKIAIAMSVNTQKFGQGLQGAATQLVSFQASVEKTGSALHALFAGVAAIGAAEGLKKMVVTASDLNENMSKTQAIFGTGSKTVVEAADQMAAAFGVSKNEFLDASSRMGGLFKGAGYSADEAAKLSVQFTKLSADASSFYNLPFDQAFTKIRAGLSGESEPLKDLGILMNEDMVKAQAFALGLAKQGEELSNQAKVQARAAIIARGLADAQGDLARTADGVANRTRELQGRIENLAGAMGTSLQPLAQSVLGEMSTAVDALTLAWNDNSKSVVDWAMSTTSGIGEATQSVGIMQRGIGFIADAWRVASLGWHAFQSIVVDGVASIIKALASMVRGLDNLITGLTGAKSSLANFLDTYDQDLSRLSGSRWTEFREQLAKPWPSESMDEYFKKARQRTEDLRKSIAAAPKAPMAPPPQVLAKPPKAVTTPKATGKTEAHEIQYAEAMTGNSREATNAVLRSRYGSAPEAKPQQETAKNTARTVQVLEKISDSLAGQLGTRAGNLLFGMF